MVGAEKTSNPHD